MLKPPRRCSLIKVLNLLTLSLQKKASHLKFKSRRAFEVLSMHNFGERKYDMTCTYLCRMVKCVWNSKKHLDSWNLCHNQAKHVIKNTVTKNLCFLCRHTYSYANLTSVFINAFGEFLWKFPSPMNAP